MSLSKTLKKDGNKNTNRNTIFHSNDIDFCEGNLRGEIGNAGGPKQGIRGGLKTPPVHKWMDLIQKGLVQINWVVGR